MDTNKGPEQNGGQSSAEGDTQLTIEPLKPKRPSLTVREVESLLAALQVAFSTDLNLAKHETRNSPANPRGQHLCGPHRAGTGEQG